MTQSVRFILAVLLMVGVVVITNLIFPPVPRGSQPAPADTTVAVPPAQAQGAQTPPQQTQPPPQLAPATPAADACRSSNVLLNYVTARSEPIKNEGGPAAALGYCSILA